MYDDNNDNEDDATWFIRDVFPTPLSPNIIIFNSTFFLDAILIFLYHGISISIGIGIGIGISISFSISISIRVIICTSISLRIILLNIIAWLYL